MPTKLSPSTCLVQVFEEANNLGSLVTIQMLHIFCVIAEANEHRKGLHMKELEKRLKLFSSTTSRNVQALGLRHTKEEAPGLELVTTAPDPGDSRAMLVFLTVKGRRLWEKLKTAVEGC